jgi:hypothetical protein
MTFGSQVLGLPPDDVLACERLDKRASLFESLDAITGELLVTALSGERVAALLDKKPCHLDLPSLSESQKDILKDDFLLSSQQQRGAWFLPEDARIGIGSANLPYHLRTSPRFAAGIATDEAARVDLRDSPPALYFWALLEDLFGALLRPVILRGPYGWKLSPEERLGEWQAVDSCYSSLSIDVSAALARVRPGGGWSRLKRPEQLSATQELVAALRKQATPLTAVRYRAWAIQALVRGFYEKSRDGGPVLMRKALNKNRYRAFSGFFGGDWLRFLNYLGETPHPDERIATALPTPKLYVDAETRTTEVAVRHGVAPEEVERMLAFLWPAGSTTSPVGRRVEALVEFWRGFDAIHASQTSGMPPLWGLVDEGFGPSIRDADDEQRMPQRDLYRRRFSSSFLSQVESLWGTVMLPRWPERIVRSMSPRGLLTQAFGPALRFWDGCGLTTWYICEGPYSRTDLPGLEKYHAKEIAGLEALGCPVEGGLFSDLIKAEKRLGKPVPIETDSRKVSILGQLSMTITMASGTRRDGFEILRDIVSRYRRAWADKYLDKYLRARWETEIRAAAREYNVLYERKAKPPTAKAFAKLAADAANHWFGGNISALYAAFGEKTPIEPVRQCFFEGDLRDFVDRVFAELGGKPTTWSQLASTIVGDDRTKQDAEWRAHGSRKNLASSAVWYLQLKEALGRQPTLAEFGRSGFASEAEGLDTNVEACWARYAGAVEACLMPTPRF